MAENYFPFTSLDVKRASKLWGGPPAADFELRDTLGELFPFEALLHEVCHAVARGEDKPNAQSPRRTLKFFETINKANPLLGIFHEAHVVAIEKLAIRLLGMHTRIPMNVVIADTWRNSNADEHMSLMELHRHIRRFEKHPKSRYPAAFAATTFINLLTVKPMKQKPLRRILQKSAELMVQANQDSMRSFVGKLQYPQGG